MHAFSQVLVFVSWSGKFPLSDDTGIHLFSTFII